MLKLKEIVTTLECVECFENEEGAQVQTIGFLAMYFYSCILGYVLLQREWGLRKRGGGAAGRERERKRQRGLLGGRERGEGGLLGGGRGEKE